MEETSKPKFGKKQRDIIIAITAVIILVLAGIFFVYILIALLVLLFMITVHELGHYLAAKCLGFKVKQFSIGMGPAIFSRVSKKNGEKFAIRCIPLGGFCSFEGDDENESNNPMAFNNQKPWKRIIVLISGALANIIVSILILITIFLISGMFFRPVVKVYDQSAFKPDGTVNNFIIEEQKLLKQDDIILEVDGVFLYNDEWPSELKNLEVGEKVKLVIVRDGERMNVEASIGYFLDADGEIYTGLGISRGNFVTYRFGFFETLGRGFVYTFRMAGTILSVLGELIIGQQSLVNVGGPITTVDVISQVARNSFRDFIHLTGLIGINLAIFNLLPFPALDGARVIFVGIEWIFKKPVKRNVEAIIHLVGLLLLFSLVLGLEFYRYVILRI
ncbi:MAG: site-2 protease family protein [Firmicutes bacterium]|nr:site-2 protease family protein [Bacillota bacterium]